MNDIKQLTNGIVHGKSSFDVIKMTITLAFGSGKFLSHLG